MPKQLLLTFLLFTSAALQAQEFRAGPLLGATFSQVDGDNYGGFNKPGVQLGAFVLRPINEQWTIQLDIAYLQKGSREKPDIEQGKTDDYEISLSYVSFPLVGRYRYKKLSAEVGLAVSALLKSKEEIDETPINDLPEHDVIPFQDIEWASVFGLNYHINKHLWVNARWLYSINRIRLPYDGDIPAYNPRPHWISRKPGQYNNNFVLSVYYAIN